MYRKMRVPALVLALCFLMLALSGCAACKNRRAVATCGEYEVPYEYLRFATLNFKAQMDDIYGDGNDKNGTIWDDPKTAAKYKPLLEEKVWNLIRDNYAVLAACAEYGIGRDVFEGKELQKAVDEQMNALKATYGSYIEYDQALTDSYMTEELFRFHYAIEEMKVRLYRAMAEDGAFLQDEQEFYAWLVNGNCAYVQHVLREVSDGEDREVERAYADAIRAGLVDPNGEGLEWYINEMNDDLTNTAPYYIMPHAYDAKLVEAALSLNGAGAVSPVIETEKGFYVLVLIEAEADTLSTQLTQLLSTYQWGVITEKVVEVKAGVKFDMTKFGNKIDLLEIE